MRIKDYFQHSSRCLHSITHGIGTDIHCITQRETMISSTIWLPLSLYTRQLGCSVCDANDADFSGTVLVGHQLPRLIFVCTHPAASTKLLPDDAYSRLPFPILQIQEHLLFYISQPSQTQTNHHGTPTKLHPLPRPPLRASSQNLGTHCSWPSKRQHQVQNQV